MYETSSKLKEIIILNRLLRNSLSMKGGSNDLLNFKEKLEKHKYYSFYLFMITSCIILYLSHRNIYNKNKLIGGSLNNNDNILENIKKIKSKILSEINKNYLIIVRIIDDFHEQILKQTRSAAGPLIDSVNVAIKNGKSIVYTVLQQVWIIPGYVPPVIPLILGLSILTYLICLFILDAKLYLPCWGCQESTSFFKCIPGTGKGSISCDIYTEFLNKIKWILSQFRFIKTLGKGLIDAIKITMNSVFYLLDNIFGWAYKAFSSSIGKIFDVLEFLKPISIPDNWGFNFGEFLICPNFSTKGYDCIYQKNGLLREWHGNNPLFQIFWKVIRVILEVPPSIPKFPLGGGSKLNLKYLKKEKLEQPKIEKVEVNTKIDHVSKKEVPDNKKDIVYEHLLRALIKIDINPIKWLAALFNLLIKAINGTLKGIIYVLKQIIMFAFKLVKMAVSALAMVLGRVFNELLKPLKTVGEIAMVLPKILYKSIKRILNLGIPTLIIHYFYSLLTKAFPFLRKLESFIIVLTLIIMILSILIICPLIGAYGGFIQFFYDIYTSYKDIIKNPINILYKVNGMFNAFIDYLKQYKELYNTIDYIQNMKEVYKYLSIVFIVILVVFIILNMFTNVNKNVLQLIAVLIYNDQKNKFNSIRSNYMKFKLETLQKEEDEYNKYSSVNKYVSNFTKFN